VRFTPEIEDFSRKEARTDSKKTKVIGAAKAGCK